MEEDVKKLKIYYFQETDSMDIWFDDPSKEHICQEINDSILVKKNKEGHIIGIEIISLTTLAKKPVELPIKMK